MITVAIATQGSFMDRFMEAIEMAERSRNRVGEIVKHHVDLEARRLASRAQAGGRRGPSQAEVDAYGEVAASNDPRYKLAIANEQWGGRLAELYGVLDIAMGQRQLIKEVRRSNDLLERIVELLERPDNG